MDIKQFLIEFCEKFGCKPSKKRDILRSNGFTIYDYSNPNTILDLYYYPEQGKRSWTYTSYCSKFRNAEIKFLWDNMLSKLKPFTEWMKAKGLTEKDLRCITGRFEPYGDVSVECSFYFRDEEENL